MSFWPELPAVVLRTFSAAYGVLLLLSLATLAPQWRRFFLSERWGGYARSSPAVDAIHRPWISHLVGLLWAGCAVALISGRLLLPAAGLNALFGYYFFVFMRWRGVLRGFGAPGYMTYWLGLALLLLELTARLSPRTASIALLTWQTDLALIVFSAGFYKFKSGYRRGEGMNYGMVNPMWGYWPAAYRRIPAGSVFFRGLNFLAWSSQLAGAALMLVPATRFLGGCLLIATYLFIATQIRLGFLAEMMCVAGLLFWGPTTPGAILLAHRFGPVAGPASWPEPWRTVLGGSLAAILGLYLLLLSLCHAGLFWNFYRRRALPGHWQGLLDSYANLFGIILWRVFSADHLNFYVEISLAPRAGRARRLLSRWRDPWCLRFWNVGEAITVTSLFTTLKYYGGDDPLFRERLWRYARTLDCPAGEEVIFDCFAILQEAGRHTVRLARSYSIDPAVGLVRCEVQPGFDQVASAHAASPVFAARRPGSYAKRAP